MTEKSDKKGKDIDLLVQLCPSAEAELHQTDLEDLSLFFRPARIDGDICCGTACNHIVLTLSFSVKF